VFFFKKKSVTLNYFLFVALVAAAFLSQWVAVAVDGFVALEN